jgi:hypothetical protein
MRRTGRWCEQVDPGLHPWRSRSATTRGPSLAACSATSPSRCRSERESHRNPSTSVETRFSAGEILGSYADSVAHHRSQTPNADLFPWPSSRSRATADQINRKDQALATGWGTAVQIGRSRKRSTGGRDVRSWERRWAGVRTDLEMTPETRPIPDRTTSQAVAGGDVGVLAETPELQLGTAIVSVHCRQP